MKRFLIITLAVWIFVLGPGLCLAGALAHACDDCTEDSFCEHEEECSADPCADAAVFAPIASIPTFLTYAVCVDERFDVCRVDDARQGWRPDARLPDENLPRPESDLPLRR